MPIIVKRHPTNSVKPLTDYLDGDISLGLERYWYWASGYWAIFTDIG